VTGIPFAIWAAEDEAVVLTAIDVLQEMHAGSDA
jgi:hypothetical protein